jgi:hypothetical protein
VDWSGTCGAVDLDVAPRALPLTPCGARDEPSREESIDGSSPDADPGLVESTLGSPRSELDGL